LFVKPAHEGSSIGISKVKQAGGVAAAYEEAARHDALVIAERGILGGEYTVGIVGDEALPIVKIEPATEWYDYEAKYHRDDTRYLCPCGLPPEQEAEIRQQALAAFRDGIAAASAPGIAANQPPQGQPAALQNPVRPERLDAVRRARRLKPATVPHVRRKHHLVQAHAADQHGTDAFAEEPNDRPHARLRSITPSAPAPAPSTWA
jgi:hypothetical protein